MNCISWICRGLGGQHAVLELTDMVKKYFPLIIFLMETRLKDSFFKEASVQTKFGKSTHCLKAKHRGWPSSFMEEWDYILDSSPLHIDAVVNPEVDDA